MSIIPHGQPQIEYYEVSRKHDRRLLDRKELVSSTPRDVLLQIYRNMVRTRCLDDKIKEMINRGFGMSEHSTRGQEAGPVAACAALAESDYMMPYHRGWAWAMGKGMEPKYLLAELLGKKSGYNKGKGGPHFGCWELGILGRPGVQAAHIPIAAGVGLAINKMSLDRVCMVFFGNGASNNGNFHEGLNLASVWKVPVIYMCENNFYQITCNYKETTACEDLGDRALGYDMPGYIVDGNDAVAIYHVVKEAVERARNGGGPSFIETKTYRLEGHNVMDKGLYRTCQEVEEWKKKDPIDLMERELKEAQLLTEEDIRRIKDEAVSEMDAASEFAISEPYPEQEDYYTDVYAD